MAPAIPEEADDDRKVCFCHNVTCRVIKGAIRAGAATVSDVQKATLASTGCGGCEYEVRDILQKAVKKSA